jgi:hypothetical protein
MKTRRRQLAILAGLVTAAIWWHSRTPEPTVLAFRLGQTFEQVVNDSTYPDYRKCRAMTTHYLLRFFQL